MDMTDYPQIVSRSQKFVHEAPVEIREANRIYGQIVLGNVTVITDVYTMRVTTPISPFNVLDESVLSTLHRGGEGEMCIE